MRWRTKVGAGAIVEHDTEQQARDAIAAAVAARAAGRRPTVRVARLHDPDGGVEVVDLAARGVAVPPALQDVAAAAERRDVAERQAQRLRRAGDDDLAAAARAALEAGENRSDSATAAGLTRAELAALLRPR